eukprot:gene3382-3872_t
MKANFVSISKIYFDLKKLQLIQTLKSAAKHLIKCRFENQVPEATTSMLQMFKFQQDKDDKMIARRYSPPPPDPYPLPSLRLVILCVSVAVALSMIVVILLIDVRPPPLSDIFLAPAYFPLGQGLQVKTRRWSRNEKLCSNYGVPKLIINVSDTLCGQAVWQSSAETEEGDRYVNRVDTIYRFFRNESIASAYFQSYWGNVPLPLPFELYTEETKISPTAGSEIRSFKWDPDAAYSQKDEAEIAQIHSKCGVKGCHSVFKHILYIFRYRDVFARLIIQGFNNSKDPRLGVEFAGRLAGIMVDLISQNQPSSLDTFIINFQFGVRFLTRTLPAGILNKAYLAVFMLGQGVIALFDLESWIAAMDLVTYQLRLLWQHLIDASFKDLYFLAVAGLLLLIHRTQTFLTPYDEMNNMHHKCRSMLTNAVEKARRQTVQVKDDILLQP